MANLKLLPLEEILQQAQLDRLTRELKEFGIKKLPAGDDDGVDLEESVSDDVLTDFMDRLEAHDLACHLFLPVEFEGSFDVGELKVGSAYALLDGLEELREELDIDEDSTDEGDEDLDMEVIEESLRHTWRAFLRAANTCVEKQVPLHVLA